MYGEGVEATSRCEADLKVKSYSEVRFFPKKSSYRAPLSHDGWRQVPSGK